MDFNDFKNTYYLSVKGREFIENISYVHPEDIEIIGDSTLEEVEIPASFWAEELIQMNQEQLKSRKPSIGYIPGNISEICDTFDGYIQLMYSTIDKESFFGYSKETYSISASSVNSFVTALTNISFLGIILGSTWLNLEGKVAIVTGGASCIGLHITQELIKNGAKVVVSDLNVDEGQQENGTYFIKVDVTNKASVDQMVAKTVELFGSVDILVNNAGVNLPRLLVDVKGEKPEYELSEKDFDFMGAVNQKGQPCI